MSTKLYKKATKVLREEGLLEFIWRGIGLGYRTTLRKVLPNIGFYTENNVNTREKSLLDRFFYIPFSNKPNQEGGIVSAHSALTHKGDSVIIVGGGKGISAIRAAKIVGETGDVSIYEGGKESIEEIHSTIGMNDISVNIDIKHAVVGEERDVYWGDSEQADKVSPKNLPTCDVLELDCEGSEIDILKDLPIRPRVIIVELHPYNYETKPTKPLKLLSEYGYDVTLRFGHNGMSIDEKDLSTLLQNRYKWGDTVPESDARPPAVIAAVHNEPVSGKDRS